MAAFISTGVLGLDIALGSGGIPCGHLTEIYGPEKCGKTALCLLIAAEAQKSGHKAAFVDIDQTLDAGRAARLGIDERELIYARPENARQAGEMARMLARSGALALVVIDSITGLLALGDENRMNVHLDNTRRDSASRELSQIVREMAVIAKDTVTAVVFTNETRGQAAKMYGVPATTPGGIALKLHAALRLEMTPTEHVRSGLVIAGEQVRVKVVKTKSTTPFNTTFVNFMYNGEVSRLDNLFDLAVELKIITLQGSSYSCSKAFLGRGHEAAVSSLQKQPQLVEELEATIRRQFLPSFQAPLDEDSM
jgi:recombination protein RecA